MFQRPVFSGMSRVAECQRYSTCGASLVLCQVFLHRGGIRRHILNRMGSSVDKSNAGASGPVGSTVVIGVVLGILMPILLMPILGPAALDAATESTRSPHSIEFTAASQTMDHRAIQVPPQRSRIKRVGFQRDIPIVQVPLGRTRERHGAAFYVGLLFEALLLGAILCGLISVLSSRPGAAGMGVSLLGITVIAFILVGVVNQMTVGLARDSIAVTPQTICLTIVALAALGATTFGLLRLLGNVKRW